MNMERKTDFFNLSCKIVILIMYISGMIFRVLPGICYFAWVIPFLVYVIEMKDEFVRKQAVQAMMLFMVSSIFSMIIYILSLFIIPITNIVYLDAIMSGFRVAMTGIVSVISVFIGTVITIFAIIAVVRAVNGIDYEIPVLNKYMGKFRKTLDVIVGTSNSSTDSNYKNNASQEDEEVVVEASELVKNNKVESKKEYKDSKVEEKADTETKKKGKKKKMDKKHIISLTGDLASGKGAVSKILMKDLDYSVYRNGEYVRKLAKDLGIDINDMNKYLEKHPEIDRDIEASASKYAKDNDNFIIDARLGWYAVPESFKVYLKVDIDEAARRAFNDENRKDTEKFDTVEEQKEAIIKRRESENLRYFEVYGVRQEDMDNYDLVVDTTDKDPEEVALIIKKEYAKWLDKE